MKQNDRWNTFWMKLAAVPYGKAVIVKVKGEWIDASVTQSVRATKEGLCAPLGAIRNVMDAEAHALIQEAFDAVPNGSLLLDKHEGRIVSYAITESLIKLEE